MIKKIPMRRCVGCMEQKSKRELIRVVRSPEGEISLDTTGKKPGQGRLSLPEPGMPCQGPEGPAAGTGILL